MSEKLDSQALSLLAKSLLTPDEFSPRLKAMIYGPKGAGKTTTAALFSKKLLEGTGKKALYIDTSDGYRSIKNHPLLINDILAMPFTTLGRVNQVVKAIAAKQAPFDNIGSVILDEGSTMALRHTVVLQRRRYPDVGEDEYPVPDWTDYRKLTTHMRGLMQFMYEDTNLHVFILSHERTLEKNNVLLKEAMPNFTPSVFDEIAGDMDIIARQTSARRRVDGEFQYVREVQSWPTNTIEAKSRVGKMPFKTGILDFVETTIDWLNRAEVSIGVETETSEYMEDD